MRRLALAVLSLAFLAACQPTTMELTEEQKAEIAEELTRLYGESVLSLNQLDQEGWLAYFQNSEDLTIAAEGGFCKSYSAFAETLRTHWTPLARGEMNWGDLNIQVLAPNVAVVTSVFDYAAIDTAGATAVYSGTWTAVWVEQDGNWKMVNVAETFPPAETSPEGT
ncbi:MAG: nuclear transport factor 2 family protein [Gemmatimonadota bacterium]|nr:MAG: nuclear transport factor 2 family protein [Gemmatimonadota bacterium]